MLPEEAIRDVDREDAYQKLDAKQVIMCPLHLLQCSRTAAMLDAVFQASDKLHLNDMAFTSCIYILLIFSRSLKSLGMLLRGSR